RPKWVIQNWLHESAALHVDYADLPLRGFEHNRTVSRGAGRIIHRTKQARFCVDECHDVLLIPNMIAGGHNRDASPEEVDRDFAIDTAPAGGVFTVYNNKIDIVLFL